MSKAIFLGSFNPPHIGHYNCIKSVIDSGVLESNGIEKIHIIPCLQNPNKQKYITSFIARYKMCEMMFKDLIIDKKVLIDDIENELRPEYTCDLLGYFHRGNDKMIGKDFWWIITEETYKEILDNKWKESKWLLENNKFIIVYEKNNNGIPEEISKLLWNEKAILIPLNGNMDIHSTLIREKVKNGESIVNETNKMIQNFIDEQYLYKL